MKREEYDIVIIGGGIYGAAAYNILANSGKKVAIIEMNDFGSGNTFATQRIIHGGLRYFQSLSIKRVLSSLKARKMWAELFPDYVKPLECRIRIKSSLMKSLCIKAATVLYSLIESKMDLMIPGYNSPIIKKNENNEYELIWYDGLCTDSERVIIDLLKGNNTNKQNVKNYSEVKGLTLKNRKIEIRYYDKYKETLGMLNTKVVINCTGKNVDINFNLNSKIKINKKYGMNLIIDRRLNCAKGEKLNGKYLFLSPFSRCLIAGTYWKDSEFIDEDINLFLSKVNKAFNKNFSEDEIVKVLSGYIPKVNNKELQVPLINKHYKDGCLLINVIGEKFTTALLTIENIINENIDVKSTKNGYKRSKGSLSESINSLSLNELMKLSDEIISFFVKNEWARNIDDIIYRRTKLYLRDDLAVIKKIFEEKFTILSNQN